MRFVLHSKHLLLIILRYYSGTQLDFQGGSEACLRLFQELWSRELVTFTSTLHHFSAPASKRP